MSGPVAPRTPPPPGLTPLTPLTPLAAAMAAMDEAEGRGSGASSPTEERRLLDADDVRRALGIVRVPRARRDPRATLPDAFVVAFVVAFVARLVCCG